ncbi:hypothetical protein RvVAR031_29630 [Agrobacterium vitis]|nr:hypothetical protein RvVAR031_29630 [Agrobacterium vitis]
MKLSGSYCDTWHFIGFRGACTDMCRADTDDFWIEGEAAVFSNNILSANFNYLYNQSNNVNFRDTLDGILNTTYISRNEREDGESSENFIVADFRWPGPSGSSERKNCVLGNN